ncbi:hypothetical protein Tco_1498818 [Tanacetum coccineum]
MMFGVTAIRIEVNAAQSKLVLVKNFDVKYSKCLRRLMKLLLLSIKLRLSVQVTIVRLMMLVQKLLLLVLKVNAAGIKLTTAERLQLLEEFMLTEKRSKTYQRKNKDFLKIMIT